MSLKKLLTNSVKYNAWANQQYVNWLSKKSEELLNKEVLSSYSSILKTIDHISGTEKYWFSVIAETAFVENQKNISLKDEVLKELLDSSNQLSHLINSYSEEELVKKVKVVSPWFESDFSKYEYLEHAINHGLYHRGQIVTIGRNIGITDAPMTDYNFYNVVKQQENKQ